MATEEHPEGDPLAALAALLAGASALAQRLGDAPELMRLLRVFERIPAPDRSVILGVLEREVEMRRMVGGAQPDLTGLQLVKANPNARLYVRVFQQPATRLPDDHDELVISTFQTARLLSLVVAPSMFPKWRAAALEAFTLLEPEELEAACRVFDELVALGREAATAASAAAVAR